MNIAVIYGGMSSEHEISCLSAKTIYEALDPARYTGRAAQQTTRFLAEVVRPVLDARSSLLGLTADIKV